MKKESDASRMLRQQREWQENKRAEERAAAEAAGTPRKKKGWRWWQIALAIFVGLAVLGSLLPDAPKSDRQGAVAQSDPTSTASGVAGDTPAADTPSNWTYSNSKDEMRGTESRHASITSENEVDLKFPYGDQRGELTLRHEPGSGLNIMLSVKSGQILCHSFTESHLSVKFDDGPVQNFSCTGASDGSSEVAFIQNEASFLKKLRKAKRTMIEAEFFQDGRQQFVFETAGLDWK